MKIEEFNSELQRRCNGLKNPNHILEVALQMQKEIFTALQATIEAQEIIIKDKSAIMEAMAQPKRCFDCKDKYDCYSYKTLTEDQTYFMCCPEYEPKAQL